MKDFNLKKFLTENKLTRASRLREQEETYKYFDKEGTGGTVIGKADGKTLYALEDSDVYDTLFYAIESESDVQFITIETEGESLRTSEIMSQLGPNKSPKIAKLIKSDIDRELGEGDEMYEQADNERAKLDAMLKSMSTYSVGPLFVEHAPKFFDGDAEEAIYQVLENIQTELEEIEMELEGDLDEGKRKSKKPLAEVKKKVKLRESKYSDSFDSPRASRLREKEEHENSYERDYQAASQLVKGADLLFSFNRPARDLDEVEELVFQHNKSGKFYYWYDEQGEETGIVEITPLEALHAVKFGLDQRSDLPERLPHGYEFEIYYKGAAGSVFSETVKRKKLNENRIQIIKADEDYAEFNYEGKLYKVSFDDGYEATENHGNFFSTGYVSGQDQFGNTWTMDAEADNGRVVDVHPDTLEMI